MGLSIEGLYLPRPGVGIDIVDVIDFTERLKVEGFREIFCTSDEIAYCTSTRNTSLEAQRFAARWAAKEAVIKALGGGGPNKIDLRKDINIKKLPSGQPFVELIGRARQRGNELGLIETALSMSHIPSLAVAICEATFERPHLT